MKNVVLKRCFRIAGRGLIGIAGVLLVYILSIGPMAGWAVGTVSGRPAEALNPALYDARLRRYFDFYRPLLRWREWLVFCVSGKYAGVFESYEGPFCRPARLADGRMAYTVIAPDISQGSPADAAKWLARQLG